MRLRRNRGKWCTLLAVALVFELTLTVASDGIEGEPPRGEAKDKLELSIEWAPTDSENEGAVWLGYLMARANYVSDHEAEYDLRPGRLTPKFEEEVEARQTASQIYRELKQADAELHLPYFEDLSTIAVAGFMREYVWAFLRQDAWKESPEDLRLDQFERWRSERIPGHQPQTHGNLSVE